MPDDVVLLEKIEGDAVWVMTMNRPERMNAIGGGLSERLTDLWQEFRDTKAARVAILTGCGDRAFSAGADLRETAENRQRAQQGDAQAQPVARRGRTFGGAYPLSEGFEVWKPTIAAVNGYAIAGGVMMAIQCDIRIAAEHARFGVAEARWNMGGAGWMTHLSRVIGFSHALELTMWGDTQISAQRAYEIGLVHQVVPKEELMDSAKVWARRMLHMAPRAVRNIKETMYRAHSMPFMEGYAFGNAIEQNLRGMKDSIEGPLAFAEKRPPVFLDE